MSSARPSGEPTGDSSQRELDQVVQEVVTEAHLQLGTLNAEERKYLHDHALKKPMGVLHIWALGVGVVITGEYFGWNPGLREAGPIGMLIASLFVCALYMMWVLALSELSVAMPFAGGPLAYGRRAVGPWLGFVMGWSMFLEALFATIGTAIATGAYIFFLLSHLFSGVDEQLTTMIAGLVTVAVFAIVQCIGAKEQAKIMEWLTYGAIVALVWFWIACWPAVRLDRIFTNPILSHGWTGVLKAIPFAIWWLVMIETVALAPEEAHEPQRTIPRGLTLAQLTLIVLVVLTWFVAAGAGSDVNKTGDPTTSFPLPLVFEDVWGAQSPHLIAFSVVALFGMVVSYNGMIYAVSRQSFALGRAGYLPRILGEVHQVRRTPVVSILFWSLVVAGFVIWGYFNQAAILVAVVTCNVTAMIWYVLAMICLFILRAKAPAMPRPYKVPLYPVLPILVIGMSLLAAVLCVVYPTATTEEPTWYSDYIVLWLTLVMYAIGLAYYFGFARTRLASAAPEELAARAAAATN